MRHSSVSGSAVLVASFVAACAAPATQTQTTRTPEGTTSVTTTTSAPSNAPASAEPSNAAALTSGEISTAPHDAVTHDVTPRWTDAQIMAAVATTLGAQEEEARAVRERTRSARIERFAGQLIMDDRELDAGATRLTRVMPGAPSDLSAKAEEARRSLRDVVRSPSSSFDLSYLDAQIGYCRALLQLLDDEMIPSARSLELKSFLQSLRSKTAMHQLRAQEIQSQIAP